MQRNTQLLQNKFNEEVFESIEKMKKEVYTPTRFIRMLHQSNNNAVEVAQKVALKNATIGIEILYEKGRLDLSMEALIVKPEYKELFSSQVINACARRLKSLGYKL